MDNRTKLHYQDQMRKLVINQGADYFVTAAFNRNTSIQNARKYLKYWHGNIDKKLLGRKGFMNSTMELRTHFFAFCEHPHSNIHWHMMLKLADKKYASCFEENADQIWQKLVPSGDLDVKKITVQEDLIRTANYCTKDLWQSLAISNWLTSAEFIAA